MMKESGLAVERSYNAGRHRNGNIILKSDGQRASETINCIDLKNKKTEEKKREEKASEKAQFAINQKAKDSSHPDHDPPKTAELKDKSAEEVRQVQHHFVSMRKQDPKEILEATQKADQSENRD
jgi:hypothetical protein